MAFASANPAFFSISIGGMPTSSSLKSSLLLLQNTNLNDNSINSYLPNHPLLNLRSSRSSSKTRALLEPEEPNSPVLLQEKPEVKEGVKLLKNAAKTRRVSKEEVLSALSIIQEAKLDPSTFLNTLGGSESPGRTWMLIFTSQDRLKRGSYFPLTAIQRFDAAAMRIENGVDVGPLGCLTFEGRFSWKKRILAFVFERVRIKVGPLGPLEISLGKEGDDREPGTKDPFFIWFYVDEEIAVAQGRGGGTAFWCRCSRMT